jgi:small-conductance mechanosensitive channel
MKIKTLIATLAITLVALVSTASARGVTNADKALVKKAMKHIGAMATIVEKATEKPAALGDLERYIDKNLEAITDLTSKLDQVEKELDAEAKAEFQKFVEARPEMKKFMNAIMGFFAKHGQDQAAMERMTKALEKLQSSTEKKEAPRKK